MFYSLFLQVLKSKDMNKCLRQFLIETQEIKFRVQRNCANSQVKFGNLEGRCFVTHNVNFFLVWPSSQIILAGTVRSAPASVWVLL